MNKATLRTLPRRLDLKTYTSGQIAVIEIDSGNDMPVAIVKADEREGVDPRAMGARIVACVNAMEGIDDPAAARVVLDEPGTAAAVDMAFAIKQTIDYCDSSGQTFPYMKELRAALKKAQRVG